MKHADRAERDIISHTKTLEEKYKAPVATGTKYILAYRFVSTRKEDYTHFGHDFIRFNQDKNDPSFHVPFI